MSFRALDASARWFYLEAHLGRRSIGWTDAPPDARLLEHFDGLDSCAILDVGCGAGRHAFALCDRGFDVVGLEMFRRPLGRAEAIAKRREGRRPRFVRGAAHTLDRRFEPSTFDAAIDVLGPASDLDRRHLDAYARALLGVLKPGGLLVVFSFLEASELVRLVRCFEVEREDRDPAGTWWSLRAPS